MAEESEFNPYQSPEHPPSPDENAVQKAESQFSVFRRGVNIFGCFMALWFLESILVTLLVPSQYLEFSRPIAEYAFFALMVFVPAYLTFLGYRNGRTFFSRSR